MASSMRLIDVVSKFSGGREEDIEQWLDRFDVAIELTTGETDKTTREASAAKLLPLFLTGSAYSTWKGLSPTEKMDMTAIKSALRRVYGMTKSAAWKELKSLKLLPGDPVDVLADEAGRLLRIIVNDNSPPEEIVALAVIDALPSIVGDQVRMQHGETMNLRMVVNSAKALLCGADHQLITSMAAVSTRDRTPNGEMSLSNSSKGKEVRCYGCGRFGHIRRDCPTKCHKCGETGHLQRNCRTSSVENSGNGAAGAVLPAHATLADEP